MKKKSEERIIKVVQLRDPNMEISEAWLGKIDSETDSDEGTLNIIINFHAHLFSQTIR